MKCTRYAWILVSTFLVSGGSVYAQQAACTESAGADLTFENEGDRAVRIFVYQDGTQVYPYPGGPDNLIDVNESQWGCDWKARFNANALGGIATLPQALLTFKFEVVGTSEVHYSAFYSSDVSGDFFHPFAAAGSQKAHFRYYVDGSQRDLLTSIAPLFSPLQFVDDVLGESWVLPYNLDYACAQPGSSCARPYTDWNVFIAPLPGMPPPSAPAYTFATGADLVLPSGSAWNWDEPGLTLRFPGGTRFIIEGTLVADGVTLTAETDWWGGIDVGIARDQSTYPNASASFTGAVIEKMWKGTKPSNAVWVYDATASFVGTIIRESQFPFEGTDFSTGLVVEGSNAAVTVDQSSEIRDHTGHGIAVYGNVYEGPRLDLLNDSKVRYNGGSGLHVAGRTSCNSYPCVYVLRSRINDNAGSGVVAENEAEVEINSSEIAENGNAGMEVRSGATVYLFGDDITASETVGLTENGGCRNPCLRLRIRALQFPRQRGDEPEQRPPLLRCQHRRQRGRGAARHGPRDYRSGDACHPR